MYTVGKYSGRDQLAIKFWWFFSRSKYFFCYYFLILKMIEANRFVKSERALRIYRALSLLLIKKSSMLTSEKKATLTIKQTSNIHVSWSNK